MDLQCGTSACPWEHVKSNNGNLPNARNTNDSDKVLAQPKIFRKVLILWLFPAHKVNIKYPLQSFKRI